MIYTAIFMNSTDGTLSRSVVFNATFDRKEAWEIASSMTRSNPFYEELFCIIPGNQEAWSPEQSV